MVAVAEVGFVRGRVTTVGWILVERTAGRGPVGRIWDFVLVVKIVDGSGRRG